jgi:hypothetical protein
LVRLVNPIDHETVVESDAGADAVLSWSAGACHHGHGPVVVEPEDPRPVGAQEGLCLVAHRTEDPYRFGPECNERRHSPQRRLLGGEEGKRLSGLGIRYRRSYELGEVFEPRLGVCGEWLAPRRENHHDPPQTSLDHNRARDGRAHARATNDSRDLPGHMRIVLDAGGATGLPNGCNDTRAVQRPP